MPSLASALNLVQDRARWKATAVAAAPALLTLALATAVTVAGFQGVDQAAQTYRVWEARHHGFALWESQWYGGEFPLSYSALLPEVGALFGIKVVSVAFAVIAAWAFDRLVTTHFGSRPLGSWYFAISTILPMTIGQLPFLSGEAVGLCAMLALQRRRRGLAIFLGLASALFSPLAAAFLAMACVAWAFYGSGRRTWLLATAAGSLAVIGALSLLFPGEGPFPFPWTELVVTELLCFTALTPLVRTTPVVRLGALLYGAASLFCFLVPNPLGGNAPRLAGWIGVPLLMCFLTAPGPAFERLSLAGAVSRLRWVRRVHLDPRWRLATFGLIIPFAVWQWAPGQSVVLSPSSDPAVQQSFYQPLVAELDALSPSPIRVEVVPTAHHWEAAFVAPYVSIARGWERQLDTADNPIFYTPGALTAASYEAWLDTDGISYVALPDVALDYSAEDEAHLIETGQITTLRPVWHNTGWQLWKVDGSPGLVTGPARLTALAPDHLTLEVSQPAEITVRERFTELWSVTKGTACLSPLPGGWTSVDALSAGTVELSASLIHQTAPAVCPSG